jgi:hypothetical protein
MPIDDPLDKYEAPLRAARFRADGHLPGTANFEAEEQLRHLRDESAHPQQLAFWPVERVRRYLAPVADFFLASASTHSGGGVHRAYGANAAAAALSLGRCVPRAAVVGRLARPLGLPDRH